MKRWKAGVAVAVVLGVALPRLLVERAWSKVDADGFTEEGVARLVADQRALIARGVFAGVGAERDAGPVLNVAMRWESDLAAGTAWWASDAWYQRVRKWRLDWLDHAAETEGLDFALLAELRAYDHWDLHASGPLHDALAADPSRHVLDPPFPFMIDLVALAKLRLLDGLRTGEIEPALAEVRHLATLVYSTETLYGAMFARSLLDLERAAEERAVRDGLLGVEGRRALTPEETATLKAVLYATAGGFGAHGGTPIWPRVLEAGEAPLGLCAGVHEAAHRLSPMRATIERPWPGERDLAGSVRAVDEALARVPCRLRRAREVWAHPEWAEREVEGMVGRVFEEPGRVDVGRVVLAIPFWRQVAIGRILGIWVPNVVGGYGGGG